MKRIIILILLLTLICSLSGGNSSTYQWDQYLANPGRTAYIDCDGPDSPQILWEVQLSSHIRFPFISEDKVVIECGGRAVLIDLLTGTILDEAVADVQYLTGAYPLGEIILGTTGGGWLYRINPVTGDAPFDVKIPDRFACSLHCHPIVLPDRLIFPSTPVVCLSRDDYSTLWDLQSTLGQLYSEDAGVQMIAASSERLHIVIGEGEKRRIWTVDINTGEFLWAKNRFLGGMIAADGALLFAGGEDLHALNVETGELLWTFEFESDYLRSNIMVGSHAVYVTDKDKLYSVEKTTGALNWKVQWTENPFWITYIVGFRDSVICSDVRDLSCFSAEDGTEIWNVHFGDFIDHDPRKLCPAVGEGILIVGGEEDSYKLLALVSDPELFKRQGDVFLLEGLVNEAINSYKKAAELYEKKGNETQSRKMQEQIVELENLQETTPPPETTPPSPKSTPTPIFVLGFFILMGIFVVYYVLKKRNP